MIPRKPQPREIFSKPAGKPLNRAVHAALLGMALSLPFGTALIADKYFKRVRVGDCPPIRTFSKSRLP